MGSKSNGLPDAGSILGVIAKLPGGIEFGKKKVTAIEIMSIIVGTKKTQNFLPAPPILIF